MDEDDLDRISGVVVNAAINVHRKLGPGLLESVYETILAGILTREGFKIDRQRSIDIDFDGIHFPAAFRVDLMVDDTLIVEIKTVERLAPIHAKQLLTYLRLTNLPVGLLLNFSCETMKEGIRRVVNNYRR